METLYARTQEEIVERYLTRQSCDTLGFEGSDYLECLDFEHAKPFLKPDVTKDQWPDEEPSSFVVRIKDYMPFAFAKAWGQRGISANRSIKHIIAWAWLSGDTEFSTVIDAMYESNYRGYGVPILRHVCEHYEWDSKAFGDCDGLPE